MDEEVKFTPREDWSFPFEWALAQMRAWSEVYNAERNWLAKQTMCVFIQVPDDNSKMTKSYLCMKIVKETENTKETNFIPRQPSQHDLLRGWRKIVE